VVLPEGRRGEIDGLADSKLLTHAVRERLYDEVVKRALAWSVVVIEAGEVDGRGLHVCNLAGMRRAFASLAVRPQYVLTDGFHVDGVSVPGLAVWKGDQVAACVAAASIMGEGHAGQDHENLHEVVPGKRLRRAQRVFENAGAAAALSTPRTVAPSTVSPTRTGGAVGRSAAARYNVGVVPRRGRTGSGASGRDNVAMEGGPR
jgi:ribonuclease HII